MKKEILIADNIDNIYDEINALIREKKTNVKKVVNDAIISLNWGIGKRLSVELTGNNKPEYGKKVVAEVLKLGEFEPQDKGQVELYLRWLEKNERVEGEESPVALILCAEKSQETIELMQLDHGNIHVGQYMTQMPPKELLEQKLSLAIANARELLEQRKEEQKFVIKGKGTVIPDVKSARGLELQYAGTGNIEQRWD